MKTAALAGLAAAVFAISAYAESISSPDGKLTVDFHLNDDGAARYSIRLCGQEILHEWKLGLVREDADFSGALKPAGPAGLSR